MRIIRPRQAKVSRYATLNREHYICPECKIHIVRDREEDMFLCLQCGRKETRWQFRQTLIANVAAAQTEWRERRERDARRDRLRRALDRDGFREQIGFVYYVKFQELIKIGTTTDLQTRLGGIQWDTLLLTEPGFYKKERERHEQFAEFQYRGEWFRPEQPLLDFIEHRREELNEVNERRYGYSPEFPLKRFESRLPRAYDVMENIHDELDWGDAIEVDEIEYSGPYYSNDRDDIVEL